MVPDCLLPPMGGDVHVDLRHLITLSLGPAVDMSDSMPSPNLDCSLLWLPCSHAGPATPGVLGRSQPVADQMEECERHPLPRV